MAAEELKPRSAALREAMDKAKSNKPPTSMLSVREASAHLGISTWTLYRLFKEEKLKSVKIGKRRLVSMAALTAFIEKLEEEDPTIGKLE
jgi:excisionase family DNA binding protein